MLSLGFSLITLLGLEMNNSLSILPSLYVCGFVIEVIGPITLIPAPAYQ